MSAPAAETIAVATDFPAGSSHQHLCGFLELFVDIMYADVVLGDRCCRRIGDALVADQEPTLQALLAAADAVMPEGLRKAISTYCVRHLLLRAPELMLTSSHVVQALRQLADHLAQSVEAETGNRPSMADVGAALLADVTALSKKLETKRYAHFVDTLGDAVLGYMAAAAADMQATADRELAESTTLLPSPFIQRFLPTVSRFAVTAAEERVVRRRRRETELNEHADALLEENEQRGKGPAPQPAEVTTSTLPEAFAAEMEAALASPARGPLSMRANHTSAPPERIPRVAVAEDSVNAGVQALQESQTEASLVQSSPSTILVDPSDMSTVATEVQGRPQQRPTSAGVVAIGGSEVSVLAMMEGTEPAEDDSATHNAVTSAEACVLENREAVARTYFLCAQTGRYEPMVAKGFFSAE